MEFEEWYEKYGEEAEIKAAELGCDRELDFNSEDWLEKQYFDFTEQ